MSEPDYINELGVKYWEEKSLTDWAKRADHAGVSLSNYRGWKAEHPDGERTFLLTYMENPLFASPRYEDVAAHIDIIKANIQFNRGQCRTEPKRGAKSHSNSLTSQPIPAFTHTQTCSRSSARPTGSSASITTTKADALSWMEMDILLMYLIQHPKRCRKHIESFGYSKPEAIKMINKWEHILKDALLIAMMEGTTTTTTS